MGNSATSGNSEESEDSKRWFFENILFFDPSSPENREDWTAERAEAGGPRVKRFTPSNARLCNRNFLIHFTFNGRPREYILKLQNQPLCRILLCDKGGDLIKEIRTTRVKHIQRQGMTVEVFVRRDRQELSSFSFSFDSVTECNLFCEFVKMLFGLQVYQVGVSPLEHFIPTTDRMRHPEDLGWESSSSDEEGATGFPIHSPRERRVTQKTASHPHSGCPVHRNKPCRCNVERPVFSKPEGEASLEDEPVEVDVSRSDKFPIAIEGIIEAEPLMSRMNSAGHIIYMTTNNVIMRYCASGGGGRHSSQIRRSTLTMKDVAIRQLNKPPPRVIEWFRSEEPGKDPSFPRSPVKTGVSYRLSQEDVGHYIQLRVLRRVSNAKADPFVYSLAVKGPVTVNSETAGAMLQILARNEVTLEVLLDAQSLADVFDLPGNVEDVRPFFECSLTLDRTGLRFESKVREVDRRLVRDLHGLCFYVLRPAAEDVDLREDNSELIVHLLSYNPRTFRCAEKVVTLRLPSEAVRDHVFHTLCLRRLTAKMPSFERWARELETGNFTGIKSYYARAWEESTWEQYLDFRKGKQYLLFGQTTAPQPVAEANSYYIPTPAAGYQGPTADYDKVASPREQEARAVAHVHYEPQPVEVASVAPAATAPTRGEAMSAKAAFPRPATAASKAAGVTAANGGPVCGAGGYSAAAPPAQNAPAGAPPKQTAPQQRINNYALYAELYRGMLEAQKDTTTKGGVGGGPRAKERPTQTGKAPPSAKKDAAAAAPEAQQKPNAATPAAAQATPTAEENP